MKKIKFMLYSLIIGALINNVSYGMYNNPNSNITDIEEEDLLKTVKEKHEDTVKSEGKSRKKSNKVGNNTEKFGSLIGNKRKIDDSREKKDSLFDVDFNNNGNKRILNNSSISNSNIPVDKIDELKKNRKDFLEKVVVFQDNNVLQDLACIVIYDFFGGESELNKFLKLKEMLLEIVKMINEDFKKMDFSELFKEEQLNFILDYRRYSKTFNGELFEMQAIYQERLKSVFKNLIEKYIDSYFGDVVINCCRNNGYNVDQLFKIGNKKISAINVAFLFELILNRIEFSIYFDSKGCFFDVKISDEKINMLDIRKGNLTEEQKLRLEVLLKEQEKKEPLKNKLKKILNKRKEIIDYYTKEQKNGNLKNKVLEKIESVEELNKNAIDIFAKARIDAIDFSKLFPTIAFVLYEEMFYNITNESNVIEIPLKYDIEEIFSFIDFSFIDSVCEGIVDDILDEIAYSAYLYSEKGEKTEDGKNLEDEFSCCKKFRKSYLNRMVAFQKTNQLKKLACFVIYDFFGGESELDKVPELKKILLEIIGNINKTFAEIDFSKVFNEIQNKDLRENLKQLKTRFNEYLGKTYIMDYLLREHITIDVGHNIINCCRENEYDIAQLFKIESKDVSAINVASKLQLILDQIIVSKKNDDEDFFNIIYNKIENLNITTKQQRLRLKSLEEQEKNLDKQDEIKLKDNRDLFSCNEIRKKFLEEVKKLQESNQLQKSVSSAMYDFFGESELNKAPALKEMLLKIAEELDTKFKEKDFSTCFKEITSNDNIFIKYKTSRDRIHKVKIRYYYSLTNWFNMECLFKNSPIYDIVEKIINCCTTNGYDVAQLFEIKDKDVSEINVASKLRSIFNKIKFNYKTRGNFSFSISYIKDDEIKPDDERDLSHCNEIRKKFLEKVKKLQESNQLQKSVSSAIYDFFDGENELDKAPALKEMLIKIAEELDTKFKNINFSKNVLEEITLNDIIFKTYKTSKDRIRVLKESYYDFLCNDFFKIFILRYINTGVVQKIINCCRENDYNIAQLFKIKKEEISSYDVAVKLMSILKKIKFIYTFKDNAPFYISYIKDDNLKLDDKIKPVNESDLSRCKEIRKKFLEKVKKIQESNQLANFAYSAMYDFFGESELNKAPALKEMLKTIAIGLNKKFKEKDFSEKFTEITSNDFIFKQYKTLKGRLFAIEEGYSGFLCNVFFERLVKCYTTTNFVQKIINYCIENKYDVAQLFKIKKEDVSAINVASKLQSILLNRCRLLIKLKTKNSLEREKNNVKEVEKNKDDINSSVDIRKKDKEIVKIIPKDESMKSRISSEFCDIRNNILNQICFDFNNFIVNFIWNEYKEKLENMNIKQEDFFNSEQIKKVKEWFSSINFDRELIQPEKFMFFYEKETLNGEQNMKEKIRALLLEEVNFTIRSALKNAKLPEDIIFSRSQESNSSNNQGLSISIRKYLDKLNFVMKFNNKDKNLSCNYPFRFSIDSIRVNVKK